MKKGLTLMVLGLAVTATVGLSAKVAAQPDRGPSDAEVDAQVDARLREVMHALLAAQRPNARMAASNR
jgi:hypothetical protein